MFLTLQTKLQRIRIKSKTDSQFNSLKPLKDKVQIEVGFHHSEIQRTSLQEANFNFSLNKRLLTNNGSGVYDFKDSPEMKDFNGKKITLENHSDVQKQNIQAERHRLLNETELPSKYQKLSEHPIIYPDCGRKREMSPWLLLSQNFDMLFLIKSSPQNINLRNLVRTTWGSIRSIRDMKFTGLFLVGQPNTNEENELLKEENHYFGDLLQCDFEDSYNNLPIKVWKVVVIVAQI